MELPDLVKAGLKPEDYVWCKGMEDWEQAKDVADICRFFRQRLFDKMHPGAAPQPQPVEPESDPDNPTDEDYKHMKRREALQALAQQVAKAEAEAEQQNPEDLTTPPSTWYPFPLILSVILFFPLGIPAILHARRAARYWKQGHRGDAYNEARIGKLYGGIALGLGLILVGGIIRLCCP